MNVTDSLKGYLLSALEWAEQKESHLLVIAKDHMKERQKEKLKGLKLGWKR